MRSRNIVTSYIRTLRARLGQASTKDRVLLTVAALFVFIGVLGSLWTLFRLGVMTIPANGGTLRIGMTGSVRFINPILASSDTDKDLAGLVFSGLMRRQSDGSIVPDLAESYSVSPDGRTYTFVIRKDASFHDGKSVTADDVVFSVRKAQDVTIKSPWMISWIDVGVDRIDDRTVQFTLKSPYGGFLLATTMGVLPAHQWLPEGDADAFEFNPENIRPVGSGPYRIERMITNDGRPARYELTRSRGTSPKPWIRKVDVRLYTNESETVAAFNQGRIDMVSAIKPISVQDIKSRRARISSEPLPRVFALFLNGNQEKAFTDSAVRQALDIGIDRKALVDQTLGGFGTPVESLMPLSGETKVADAANPDTANRLLDQAGWKRNSETGIRSKSLGGQVVPLSFALATANTPELADAARLIAEQLTALGFEVSVQVFDLGTLDRDIIRPRNYDALLFGHVYRHDTDAYAFWHSSQRTDPGLNIARYADQRVDRALEQAFASEDVDIRAAAYAEAEARLLVDRPAIALYQPNHITITRPRLRGRANRTLIIPSDRFTDTALWYVESDTRWNIFAPHHL